MGLFEVSFEKRSQFIYRLKEKKEVEMFFIRKPTWNQLVNLVQNKRGIVEQFKTKLLLNYIDKVYLPIKGYQNRPLQMSKMSQQKPIANIVALLTGKTI